MSLYSQGETFDVPEVVPFRLTQNMVHGMVGSICLVTQPLPSIIGLIGVFAFNFKLVRV